MSDLIGKITDEEYIEAAKTVVAPLGDGDALCGRRGWYERPPEAHEMMCPRCVEISLRVEEVIMV